MYNNYPTVIILNCCEDDKMYCMTCFIRELCIVCILSEITCISTILCFHGELDISLPCNPQTTQQILNNNLFTEHDLT